MEASTRATTRGLCETRADSVFGDIGMVPTSFNENDDEAGELI
jgi:hypothetical protein